MDEFITGKIQKINQNEDSYGIILNTSKDSTILSMAFKEDFKGRLKQLQNLQVGQKISIKGFLFCEDGWKRKENCPAVIIKRIKY